jgi:AraC-like DNA-binding protein
MVTFDPRRPDFAPYGLTCERWTPQQMGRADRHNEIEVNLVRQGRVVYLLGGREVPVVPGRLTVFWAAIPHQIVRGQGEEPYFVLTLPLAWFVQSSLPRPFVEAVLHGAVAGAPDESRAACDWKACETWERDLGAGDPETRAQMLFEVEARLRRLALDLRPDLLRGSRRSLAPRRVANAALSNAERMACYIATHYTEPIAVADVAKAVALHPNYAMTAFHAAFGTTLRAFVQQHRLAHAQRLLVTTDRAIIDIAMDAGFGSLSRFNAAFRAHCGCTPRAFRARHGQPFLRATSADRTGGGRAAAR